MNSTFHEQEPWQRGTHAELDVVRRAVVHALELAEEDVERWCAPLDDAVMFERVGSLPSVAFHLRHIVRSLDRLLTYAEANALTTEQFEALRSENAGGTTREVMAEFRAGLVAAKARVIAVDPATYTDPRKVGRAGLLSTVGGLLIHCAEHTSRHVGQAVTTAKLVRNADSSAAESQQGT
jgi:uncharacterized damage-inducible protein DinB